MDVPKENRLQDDGDKDDQKNREDHGLIVEDSDSLVRCANRGKPVELAHCEA